MKLSILLALLLMAGSAYAGQAKPPHPHPHPHPHPMKSAVVHFEIMVSNLNVAQNFYGNLFGWTITRTKSPYLAQIKTGSINGMFIQHPGAKGGSSTVIYMEVPHLKLRLNRAIKLGATIDTPPTAIPGVGSYAIIKDLDGNHVGLFSKEMKP